MWHGEVARKGGTDVVNIATLLATPSALFLSVARVITGKQDSEELRERTVYMAGCYIAHRGIAISRGRSNAMLVISLEQEYFTTPP